MEPRSAAACANQEGHWDFDVRELGLRHPQQFSLTTGHCSIQFGVAEKRSAHPLIADLGRLALGEQLLVAPITTAARDLEGEHDAVFAGQAAHVASQLRAPHEHVVMRSADGAGAHCHEGAMYLLHQTVFNFLQKTLT